MKDQEQLISDLVKDWNKRASVLNNRKIKEVYYAFEDPDIRTFKKAKKFFKSKNVNDNNLELTAS